MLLSTDYNQLKLLHHNKITNIDQHTNIPIYSQTASSSFKIDDILSKTEKMASRMLDDENNSKKMTKCDYYIYNSFQENNNNYEKTVCNILNQNSTFDILSQQDFNSKYLLNNSLFLNVPAATINEHLFRNLEQQQQQQLEQEKLFKKSVNFTKPEKQSKKDESMHKKIKNQNKIEKQNLTRMFAFLTIYKKKIYKNYFKSMMDVHTIMTTTIIYQCVFVAYQSSI